MSNTTKSAKIGKPPNNVRDYNIIRGIYRQYGITTLDPSLGYVFAAKEPKNAVHESKQPAIIAGMVIVMLAIIVPTAARLWILVVVDAGGGTHTWENTYNDYQFYSYYLTICRLLYYPTVGIIKISITLFIRRIVDTAYRTWRIVADIFLGALVAYVVLAVFWSIFICNPPRAVWDREFAGSLTEQATCGDQFLSAKILSIIHVVQSVLLLATPIVILWRIRIDRGKKIRLFIIWAAGGLTVTGGLLQQIQPFKSPDIFWEYTIILRWTVLDIAMGTVTASLPVLDSAIMVSWRTAKSTLGLSNRERDNSRETNGTKPETIGSGPRKAYISSAENIIREGGGIEMDVMRQNNPYENGNAHSIPDTAGHDERYKLNTIV
ncbi:uncharacterized protein ColSpa_04849 [Colletotrichum spaethianum]|uniref:Rhodopsin domain-containing protein n=1 Tax=Colletotrichum spaethianum TaxID=700344 RepID=A0AA37LA77_9PEZI|nr:uncharacterized protein ColSpa_04849 [Colletotrichum spaethianum]GKT44668.1 hypothetical protein ColSpa_04849 [Colletotrichum spaethianum]